MTLRADATQDQIITAINDLQAGETVTVYKTADESVTSSTTTQDDDHLFFPVAADEKWIVELTLFVTGADAGDLLFGLNAPSGSSNFRGGYHGLVSSATTTVNDLNAAGNQTGPGVAFVGGTIATASVIRYFALIENGSTAGDVRLQWAQNVSDATATIILRGSYLIARKVT